MSIIGPRPHALKTKLNNNFYIYKINNYNYRFLIKPGITSLSHVRNSAGQLATMSKLKDMWSNLSKKGKIFTSALIIILLVIIYSYIF